MSERERAREFLMAGFLNGMVFGAGVWMIFTDPAWVGVVAVLGGGLGFGFVAWFIERKIPTVCLNCKGRGIMLNAGSMDRDDGFCELRECSVCGDGERIGRSDVPIVSDYDPTGLIRER